jgi:hypothetical protein
MQNILSMSESKTQPTAESNQPANRVQEREAMEGAQLAARKPVTVVADLPTATPRYMQFQRKEARLREDQADELSVLARKLSRAKAGPGERITDNTLIRVAVDLLLAQKDRLAGEDEGQLRRSVGL